jgi:hypothetical protein
LYGGDKADDRRQMAQERKTLGKKGVIEADLVLSQLLIGMNTLEDVIPFTINPMSSVEITG